MGAAMDFLKTHSHHSDRLNQILMSPQISAESRIGFHLEQLVTFGPEHAGDRDSRPGADHPGNVLVGDLFPQHPFVVILCSRGDTALELFEIRPGLSQFGLGSMRGDEVLVEIRLPGAGERAVVGCMESFDRFFEWLQLAQDGFFRFPLGLESRDLLLAIGDAAPE